MDGCIQLATPFEYSTPFELNIYVAKVILFVDEKILEHSGATCERTLDKSELSLFIPYPVSAEGLSL